MGNVEPYDYPVGRGIFGRSARSQLFEDLALYEQFFVGQRDGFFVEMGALDGIYLSNTFAFEDKLGWSGVLLEANPRACRTLFRNRPRAIKLCTAVSMNHSWLTFQDTGSTSRRLVTRPNSQTRSPSASTRSAVGHASSSRYHPHRSASCCAPSE